MAGGGSGIRRPIEAAALLAMAAALGLGCAASAGGVIGCDDYEACIERAADAQGRGDDTAVRRFLELACDHDPAGCNPLGDHLEASFPGAPAAELAYKRACSGGSAEGCARLGRLYRSAEAGRVPNAARAQQALERACEIDSGYCDEAMERQGTGGIGFMGVAPCAQAADCMAEGWIHWEHGDLPSAVDRFQQACELGDPGGCEEAGYLLVGWGSGLEVQRGMGLLQRACTMGRATACQALMNGAQTP